MHLLSLPLSEVCVPSCSGSSPRSEAEYQHRILHLQGNVAEFLSLPSLWQVLKTLIKYYKLTIFRLEAPKPVLFQTVTAQMKCHINKCDIMWQFKVHGSIGFNLQSWHKCITDIGHFNFHRAISTFLKKPLMNLQIFATVHSLMNDSKFDCQLPS